MNDQAKPRPRALISVYDKTQVVELAQGLHDLGWDLVSSGGTARSIREAGIPVAETAEITGFPAILGHRVVTLHPKIHGGILADRSNPHHVSEMRDYGIEPFDLVVGNLYPFGSGDFSHGDLPEDAIDIGGPAMVRAAAKNHACVGVVTDPSEYNAILKELRADGSLSPETRRRLARAAFAHTAAYDAAVVAWFDESDEGTDFVLPPSLHLSVTRDERQLRYGENPHQRGALYQTDGASPWWHQNNLIQHGGVTNSYLNFYDADAAWAMVHWAQQVVGDKPVVAIIKHANPCGFATDDTLAEAYRLAFEADPKSAFGGIVALNQPIDDDTVAAMVAAAQADVIIAPGYDLGVVEALQLKRKGTRLLETHVPPTSPTRHMRPISGGWLVQDPYQIKADPNKDWRVVTDRRPTAEQWEDARLADYLSYWCTSNAIVLVKDGVAWGLGVGQQNRVQSGQIATEKADGRAKGGVCASDAFYPFPDGIEAAAAAGVAVIIQPGGSIRDDECIAKANELGLAMIFTGERHFKH